MLFDRTKENHPELLPGEVFWCNVHGGADFDGIDLQTKRLGRVAYSVHGHVIKPLVEGGGPFPVFVQRSELVEKGEIEA